MCWAARGRRNLNFEEFLEAVTYSEQAELNWVIDQLDWDNILPSLLALPKPCQHLFACRVLIDEINNGGVDAFYYNGNGYLMPLAKEGFAAIGDDEMADMAGRIDEIYQKNRDILERVYFGDEDCEEGFFDEALHKEFYALCEKTEARLSAYVRANAKCFAWKK